MTNLTEKFLDQAEVLRGARTADVVTALIDGLPPAIAEEIVASSLATNIANDLVASALSQNIANDLVASALSQNIANDLVASSLAPNIAGEIAASGLAPNIASTTYETFQPKLDDILGAVNFWGQEVTGSFGPLQGDIEALRLATVAGFNAVAAAINALAECCALLDAGIQQLNTNTNKIGANLTDIGAGVPPDAGDPPPVPGGGNSFWLCGQFYPVWVFAGNSGGNQIWEAFCLPTYEGVGGVDPILPASRFYGYQEGWSGAGPQVIRFEPGTYSLQRVGAAGGTIRLSNLDEVPPDRTYSFSADTEFIINWIGSGSPPDCGLKICRQMTIE